MIDQNRVYLVGVILIVLSYLIGNISPATILARASGHDIKEEGSGNAGTTNVLRVVGAKAAAVTLVVDVLKGFIPTKIGFFIILKVCGSQDLFHDPNGLGYALTISAFCGLAAFLGHVFPVLLKFKGGKGVATALGVILATNWKITVMVLILFIIIVALTRMVSLGSISAALAFLILYLADMFKDFGDTPVDAFSVTIIGIFLGPRIFAFALMVIILIVKHRANIGRIIRGEENRLSFGKKK